MLTHLLIATGLSAPLALFDTITGTAPWSRQQERFTMFDTDDDRFTYEDVTDILDGWDNVPDDIDQIADEENFTEVLIGLGFDIPAIIGWDAGNETEPPF